MPVASFFSAIKSAAGTSKATIPSECKTLAAGLSHLMKELPNLGERIMDADGKTLRPTITILLDGQRIEPADFDATAIDEDSQLSFFEALSGG